MSFAAPFILFWLLAPLAFLIWELVRRRRAPAMGGHPKILRAEAGSTRVQLSRGARPTRRGPRLWLFLGLCFAIIALARPQWGRLEEPVFDQSREILIAMDLSRSMLSTDVKPSRLERSKLLVESLLDQLRGERVGLVIFSGTSFLQAPLSSDYTILREFLPEMNPGYLPEGGSNYGALLDAAASAFSEGETADRYLIVLSDGEATDDNWKNGIEELTKKKIRVIGLGVGSSGGSMIPDGAGGFIKDERGAVVFSRLESGTLRELAQATDGLYQDASAWLDLPALLKATVERGQKGKFTEKIEVRHVERFQWPLGLAAWFLLLSFLYDFPVRPKPRAVRLEGRDSSPPPVLKTVALVAFLLLPLAVVPRSAAQSPRLETPPPPAPSTDTLSKITSRLSIQDVRSARDWSEFARETLTLGQRLQSSQKPVPEGPVNDALAAVALGEKLDPKLTDWPTLRKELQALLHKSNPPPPEDQKNQDQKSQDKKSQDQKDNEGQSSDSTDGSGEKKDPSKGAPDKPQDKKSDQDPAAPQEKESPGEPKDAPKNQEKASPPAQRESAFGDMKQEPPASEQPTQPQPQPDPGDMQKVGGAAQEKRPDAAQDPALAVPLQKLEQVRRKDAPGDLFQFLNSDQSPNAPAKNSKNW